MQKHSDFLTQVADLMFENTITYTEIFVIETEDSFYLTLTLSKPQKSVAISVPDFYQKHFKDNFHAQLLNQFFNTAIVLSDHEKYPTLKGFYYTDNIFEYSVVTEENKSSFAKYFTPKDFIQSLNDCIYNTENRESFLRRAMRYLFYTKTALHSVYYSKETKEFYPLLVPTERLFSLSLFYEKTYFRRFSTDYFFELKKTYPKTTRLFYQLSNHLNFSLFDNPLGVQTTIAIYEATFLSKFTSSEQSKPIVTQSKQLSYSVLASFAFALEQVIEVGTFKDKNPPKESHYSDDFTTHLFLHMRGEINDADSGLSHLAHACWNLLTVMSVKNEV